jgi:hypothetical protein
MFAKEVFIYSLVAQSSIALDQSYRCLVGLRLGWLPHPGFRVNVSRFSEGLGRGLSEL